MPHSIELQQIVAELSELAGGLAHELRNPLSTIKVNLKLLAEDLAGDAADQPESRRRMRLRVGTLLDEVDRLQVLFDRFLTAAGPDDVDLVPVDFNVLVGDLVQFFEPTAAEQGISLIFVPAGSSICVLADAPKMRQALLNILVNAKEAMPTGGPLRVQLERTENRVQLRVTDTGVGMREEELEQATRPFFTTKAKGTGLGLAITRRIIRDHDGSIEFISAEGKGTIVVMTLPFHE